MVEPPLGVTVPLSVAVVVPMRAGRSGAHRQGPRPRSLRGWPQRSWSTWCPHLRSLPSQ